MLLLGFIVSICFIPGITGAAVPTQWVVLSATLPWFLWRHTTPGPAHWLALCAVAWGLLTSLWSSSHYDSLFGIWLLGIWALSFRLGATKPDLSALFRGLALGLSVSSILTVVQWWGLSPILMNSGAPAGLLYNSTVLGASTALVILACIELSLWRYIPLLLPGFILCQSRGAWIIVAFGLVAKYAGPKVLLAGVFTLFLILGLFPANSDHQRMYIWGVAINNLNWLGNGIGSFNSYYYIVYYLLFHDPKLVHPEFVHNDYIQLWFELGVGAIPMYTLLALALAQTKFRLRGTLYAFAVLGLFYFPLWCPITAFIGCLLAGRAIANWHYVRGSILAWGPDIIPRHHHPQPQPDRLGGRDISIQPLT